MKYCLCDSSTNSTRGIQNSSSSSHRTSMPFTSNSVWTLCLDLFNSSCNIKNSALSNKQQMLELIDHQKIDFKSSSVLANMSMQMYRNRESGMYHFFLANLLLSNARTFGTSNWTYSSSNSSCPSFCISRRSSSFRSSSSSPRARPVFD